MTCTFDLNDSYRFVCVFVLTPQLSNLAEPVRLVDMPDQVFFLRVAEYIILRMICLIGGSMTQ